MNFLRQGFRNLSSDRQTYIQTDTTKIIYHAASWAVNNCAPMSLVELTGNPCGCKRHVILSKHSSIIVWHQYSKWQKKRLHQPPISEYK